MRPNLFAQLALAFLLISIQSFAGIWNRVENPAARQSAGNPKYLIYTADEATLKGQLFSLSVGSSPFRLELPMPDGTMRLFNVRYTPIMPEALAAKYPEIRTFTAVADDNPAVTAKLDFTGNGFHAMVFEGHEESFIDPVGDGARNYSVHYRKDELRHEMPARCQTVPGLPATKDKTSTLEHSAARTINGNYLRTYRLALTCAHQYARAVTGMLSPTVPQVFDHMTTTMNRVNGVYEREMSITMQFVAQEDALIWNVLSGGPNGPDRFSDLDTNSRFYGSNCSIRNQEVCDDVIGTSNYDIGHVFTTGAGGFSQVGVVCMDGAKAQSATGKANPTGGAFDIDYVAHEMGHEFGANHTFNTGEGNCGGNIDEPTVAFEPGSGSTIMAYAGICGPDDLQPHSDDYFHAASLMEITKYLTGTIGSGCGVKTSTSNKAVNLAPFQASYFIPYLTPFELTAPTAVDSVADTLTTYCWEQWNTGAPYTQLINTHELGPLFRSYKATTSPTRVFPKDTMVLAGILSNAGIENNEGEKLPDVARYLTFRLTVRDILNGYGCFLTPDDTIHLNVVTNSTNAGFTVTSQDDSTIVYVGGTGHDVTWSVAETNNAPVSAANVDIFMSEDGGYTWPHHIGTFPNTGMATIPFPNPAVTTTKARIKVKGKDNVFFNVNKYNFTVTQSDNHDTIINLYPNPVRSTLRISSGNKGPLHFRIYNDIGKEMYEGVVNGLYDIPVNAWPRGMYFAHLVNQKKQRTVKKFVVE